MVKSTKKDANDAKTEDNAENRERQRLRKLAFNRKLISQTRSNPSRPLQPTKIILNCDGKDIVKKGQRKTKYLFSFPCLVAPVSGGKMGELAHLDTKNPVLYVDFPQGRLKFFGTIIYPKNKYLTLHFMRGSGNVVCEDSFDSIVVFSDVWWIGTKEENPEEVQLDFPKELKQEKHAEFDFKGGAGTIAHHKSVATEKLPSKECDGALYPETDFKLDQLQDSQQPKPRISKHNIESLEEEIKPTPVRSSARTAGKAFKFADSPSEDDIDSTGNDSSSSDSGQAHQAKKQKVNRNLGTALDEAVAEDFTPALIDTGHDKKKTALDEVQNASSSARKTPSQKKPKETPSKLVGTTKGVLVQSSMSSFLQKPEEKSSQKSERTPVGTKGSAQRRRSTDLKGKSKKTKDIEEKLSDEDIIEEVPKESKKVVRRTSGRGESTSKGKQIKSPIKLDSSDEEKTSIESEVQSLTEASNSSATLQALVEFDIISDSVRTRGSHSRNLLRVKRGLDMVKVLFERLLATEGDSLRDPASVAYEQVFAPHHGWAIRKAVGAGMYSLPTKSQFLRKLNDDEASARVHMQNYVDTSAPVIQYVDNLFHSRNLGTDW